MLESLSTMQLEKLRCIANAMGLQIDPDGFPYFDKPGAHRHYFDPVHDNADALRLLYFCGLTHERMDYGVFIRNRAGRLIKWKQGWEGLSEDHWLAIFRSAIFDAGFTVLSNPDLLLETAGQAASTVQSNRAPQIDRE